MKLRSLPEAARFFGCYAFCNANGNRFLSVSQPWLDANGFYMVEGRAVKVNNFTVASEPGLWGPEGERI